MQPTFPRAQSRQRSPQRQAPHFLARLPTSGSAYLSNTGNSSHQTTTAQTPPPTTVTEWRLPEQTGGLYRNAGLALRQGIDEKMRALRQNAELRGTMDAHCAAIIAQRQKERRSTIDFVTQAAEVVRSFSPVVRLRRIQEREAEHEERVEQVRMRKWEKDAASISALETLIETNEANHAAALQNSRTMKWVMVLWSTALVRQLVTTADRARAEYDDRLQASGRKKLRVTVGDIIVDQQRRIAARNGLRYREGDDLGNNGNERVLRLSPEGRMWAFRAAAKLGALASRARRCLAARNVRHFLRGLVKMSSVARAVRSFFHRLRVAQRVGRDFAAIARARRQLHKLQFRKCEVAIRAAALAAAEREIARQLSIEEMTGLATAAAAKAQRQSSFAIMSPSSRRGSAIPPRRGSADPGGSESPLEGRNRLPSVSASPPALLGLGEGTFVLQRPVTPGGSSFPKSPVAMAMEATPMSPNANASLQQQSGRSRSLAVPSVNPTVGALGATSALALTPSISLLGQSSPTPATATGGRRKSVVPTIAATAERPSEALQQEVSRMGMVVLPESEINDLLRWYNRFLLRVRYQQISDTRAALRAYQEERRAYDAATSVGGSVPQYGRAATRLGAIHMLPVGHGHHATGTRKASPPAVSHARRAGAVPTAQNAAHTNNKLSVGTAGGAGGSSAMSPRRLAARVGPPPRRPKPGRLQNLCDSASMSGHTKVLFNGVMAACNFSPCFTLALTSSEKTAVEGFDARRKEETEHLAKQIQQALRRAHGGHRGHGKSGAQ